MQKTRPNRVLLKSSKILVRDQAEKISAQKMNILESYKHVKSGDYSEKLLCNHK